MKITFKEISTDKEYDEVESWLTEKDKANLGIEPTWLTWKEDVERGKDFEKRHKYVVFQPFVFYKEDKLVAAFNLKQVKNPKTKQDELVLSQIIINPTERGKGLANSITAEIIENSDCLGFTASIIKANTAKNNIVAIECLKRLGMKQVGEGSQCYNFEMSVKDRFEDPDLWQDNHNIDICQE